MLCLRFHQTCWRLLIIMIIDLTLRRVRVQYFTALALARNGTGSLHYHYNYIHASRRALPWILIHSPVPRFWLTAAYLGAHVDFYNSINVSSQQQADHCIFEWSWVSQFQQIWRWDLAHLSFVMCCAAATRWEEVWHSVVPLHAGW